MIYVSSDLETMNIEPEQPDRIIGASFVIEDSDHPEVPVKSLPNLTFLVDQGEYITGSYGALAMNARFLKMIEDHKRGRPCPLPVYKTRAQDPLNCWEMRLLNFLRARGTKSPGQTRYILAGKNPGIFDYQFFPKDVRALFIHRCIDAGSAMIDFSKGAPPSSTDLAAKFQTGDVAHDMYEDACDVITWLRHHPTYPRPHA